MSNFASIKQDMKPHRIAFGQRYGDDSGWERLVSVDRQEGKIEVEVMGGEFSCGISELDWLIEALTKARAAIEPF